jgi:hypothetical protein
LYGQKGFKPGRQRLLPARPSAHPLGLAEIIEI